MISMATFENFATKYITLYCMEAHSTDNDGQQSYE